MNIVLDECTLNITFGVMNDAQYSKWILYSPNANILLNMQAEARVIFQSVKNRILDSEQIKWPAFPVPIFHINQRSLERGQLSSRF